jgi:hypothetical protein
MKLTDIDGEGAIMWHFVFATHTGNKCPTEQREIVRLLTVKGLKAKGIEIELTCVDGDQAIQISA